MGVRKVTHFLMFSRLRTGRPIYIITFGLYQNVTGKTSLRVRTETPSISVWVPVVRLFLVEPMRIQTTIGSAKKLASFAEEKFGVGALSISDSKSNKKKKKKRWHFATIAVGRNPGPRYLVVRKEKQLHARNVVPKYLGIASLWIVWWEIWWGSDSSVRSSLQNLFHLCQFLEYPGTNTRTFPFNFFISS